MEQLFIAAASVGLASTLLDLIGANLYDVQAVKRQRAFRRHPHARQYRHRPLVSVVVETRDDATVIERCLGSLTAGTYRKLEVVVIDNASRDITRRTVKQFIAQHPRKTIRLVARRSRQGTPTAITATIKKHTHGELILLLNSGNIIDKTAITVAVRHYNTAPSLDALVLNRRTRSAFSTLGLFQQYEELLHARSKKFWSLAAANPVSDPEAVLYRRDALPGLRRPRGSQTPLRAAYASDAIVYSLPQRSFYRLIRQQYRRQRANLRLLRQWRLVDSQTGRSGHLLIRLRWLLSLSMAVIALFVPFLVSYFVYMAIGLHQPAFLMLSWLAVTLLVLFAIWEDEQLRVFQKTLYSLLIPITYGMFIVISCVQVFTILRTALIPGTRQFTSRT